MKKRKGNIAITTTIFLIFFIVFCAFGLDSSFVVLDRFKLQKATETVALSAASYLKAGIPEANLPAQVLAMHRLPAANITSLNTRVVDGGYAVQVSTEMPSETYFLRFVGVNYVILRATSTAQTYTQEPEDQAYGKTMELAPILTDKRGEDFSVESEYGYYVFAGIDNGNSVIWEDIGCKANVEEEDMVDVPFGSQTFKAICKNATFNLSNFCEDKPYTDSIGLVKYIRVYKDPNACTIPPTGSGPNVKVKVLNNVRLIRSSDFPAAP